MTTTKSSYAQILKTSSIMGGAAGINLLLGMVRVKFAAVLIGATGVGLNASFGALQGLIGTLAGLGIQSSAVRDIAAAVGKNDEHAIGRAVLTLRRICWLTGLAGMAAMMMLAPLLSQLTFGNRDYALDIAALGVVILFGNLSGGQMALIQGMRRIGDMARVNIVGAVFGTVAAIGFYATLGLRGIIPTLVAVSAFQLALSWHFALKMPVLKVELTLRQTFAEANGMVRLGLVFMANGLMGSVVAYITIALITQYEGMQAVGLYSAAFALSGMFVNFVLGAMGADYYPRLTAVASDPATMNRVVNEQTEISLLLAAPGLMATIVFAHPIIQFFYTSEFKPAADLLQWLALGCLGRVISWPLGYILLAQKKMKDMLTLAFISELIHIVLIIVGLLFFGLTGVAIAFPMLLIFTTITLIYLTRKKSGVKWDPKLTRLVLLHITVFLAAVIVLKLFPSMISMMAGGLITLTLTLVASFKLAKLLDKTPSFIKKINKLLVFKNK